MCVWEWEVTRNQQTPLQNTFFLNKTEVWPYISWLTDTTRNRSKCVGLNAMYFASGGLKATKQQGLGLEIVHMYMYFIEVSDSVLGAICLEFFWVKLLDKQGLSWLADWTSHMAYQDAHVRG